MFEDIDFLNKVKKIKKNEWKEFIDYIKSKGWKVEEDFISNLKIIPEDTVFYYDLEDNNEPYHFFEISKGKDKIYAFFDGEIEIHDKDYKNKFIFHYGKPDGKLTYDLYENGIREENNWIEINFNNRTDVAHDLKEFIKNVEMIVKNR